MRVLHLFNEINFSGAELMYRDAADYFREKGVEMYAMGTAKNFGNFVDNFREKGINTVHKPYRSRFVLSRAGLSFYWFLYKFLKQKKIDVLHIHRDDIYFATVIAYILGIRSIKTQHSIFYNRKRTLPISIARRKIVRIFFKTDFHSIGESVHSHELKYYKNPSAKINNWYNPKRFYGFTDAERSELKRKLNIPNDAFVIISVGGCAAIKNHHDVLKAIARLKGKLDILYLHLGKGKTECEEKQLAKDLGINEMVRFEGNKDNVRDYLIASDVFVMTSKFEGLGNSCLEAMACALPVILYDVVGLRDLISNDDNGFLIEPNPKELADKIVLYSGNPGLRSEKGANASVFVNKNHSMFTNVDLMLAFYKKGLDRNHETVKSKEKLAND
ncbi:glycosyltransferase family 4 protein [Aequorivita todarodis]|uniref:glycosyltransferase family 4 protein n=1 Tax=Aequorivita todarodis TaxID=2036821 RepID=UPI00235092AB|nr:glycosyltransferase family 4 protein [Aequorivita todarodis]MDC8001195.1 glycosyltransferase family 4 protein [Aequorivita todarodis]